VISSNFKVLPEHGTVVTDIRDTPSLPATRTPSTNVTHNLADDTHYQSVQVVPYSFKNKYISAINLSDQLDDLYVRCLKKSGLQMKHLGEYMSGIRELVQISRELDVITEREGMEMMKFVLA
jgi:hypothetical protein